MSDKLEEYQLYINGQWVNGSEKQTMVSENPATGKEWARFACAAAEDINRAVYSAKKALTDGEWASMNASQRGKLLYRLADLIESHAQQIGEIESRDSGKLVSETVPQTKYVADYYRYFAGLADKIEGATLPIDKPDMHVYTTRIPIGVVAAVVPWNAQMFLTSTKLGPALAAGCSVIIKASEVAPCAIFELAKLIDKVGFPPGVVSVVTGDAKSCAIPLTSHPDVDRIAFTGGTESARHVIKNSANNFAVTSLELGGKSPILVFDDCHLESAANGIIAGNFGASGQSCVAGSRVLVQRNILDKIVNLVTEKAQTIVVGDPQNHSTHLGPLCTKAQINHIEKVLKKSTDQGAKIHFGGNKISHLMGNYFEPTLVISELGQAETINVELFGPVITMIAFDNEQEAIQIANNSEFGLGSGIFTQNLARAHRVSSKLRAGICWINTYRAISPIAPFGGFNHSGYGREAGLESIYDYTRTRTTWINISDQPMKNPFVMR